MVSQAKNPEDVDPKWILELIKDFISGKECFYLELSGFGRTTKSLKVFNVSFDWIFIILVLEGSETTK